MQSELDCAIRAARRAGRLLLENFGPSIPVEYKGQIDPVTVLDRKAERLIAEILSAAFPDYDVLGEEEHHSADGSKPFWIVDPLDGTTNFAHGYPLFAVSIALAVDGQVVIGTVFNPVLDELFGAVRGQGAALNGQPIKVSSVGILGQALIASGFPYDAWTSDRDNLAEWGRFVKAVLSPRCDGCASLDLCHVANGRLDGYWELDLEPWDMAAGGLIAAEAGALVTDASGQPFDVNQRSVLAANPKLHPQMASTLREACSNNNL